MKICRSLVISITLMLLAASCGTSPSSDSSNDASVRSDLSALLQEAFTGDTSFTATIIVRDSDGDSTADQTDLTGSGMLSASGLFLFEVESDLAPFSETLVTGPTFTASQVSEEPWQLARFAPEERGPSLAAVDWSAIEESELLGVRRIEAESESSNQVFETQMRSVEALKVIDPIVDPLYRSGGPIASAGSLTTTYKFFEKDLREMVVQGWVPAEDSDALFITQVFEFKESTDTLAQKLSDEYSPPSEIQQLVEESTSSVTTSSTGHDDRLSDNKPTTILHPTIEPAVEPVSSPLAQSSGNCAGRGHVGSAGLTTIGISSQFLSPGLALVGTGGLVMGGEFVAVSAAALSGGLLLGVGLLAAAVGAYLLYWAIWGCECEQDSSGFVCLGQAVGGAAQRAADLLDGVVEGQAPEE